MTEKAIFTISGMHCTSCARLIEMDMREQKDVRSVSVDYEAGEAILEFDAGQPDIQHLTDVIEALGYKVVDVRSA